MQSLFDDHEDFADLADQAPTPDQPWWRDASGGRSTFAVERAGADAERRTAVEAAHLQAVGAIARAALEARRADDGELARAALEARTADDGELARRYAHGCAPPGGVEE